MMALKGLTNIDFNSRENLIFRYGVYYDMYKFETNLKISMGQHSNNNLLEDKLIFQVKAEIKYTN